MYIIIIIKIIIIPVVKSDSITAGEKEQRGRKSEKEGKLNYYISII